jgi:hypothetical protein
LKVEMDLARRAVITSLLRKESLRLKGVGQPDASTEGQTLATWAEELERWPEETAPSRVDNVRDMKV